MTSRETILLTADDLSDPERAANRLNFIFSHILERLDRIEGLGSAAIIRQPVHVKDTDDNIIHSMGT